MKFCPILPEKGIDFLLPGNPSQLLNTSHFPHMCNNYPSLKQLNHSIAVSCWMCSLQHPCRNPALLPKCSCNLCLETQWITGISNILLIYVMSMMAILNKPFKAHITRRHHITLALTASSGPRSLKPKWGLSRAHFAYCSHLAAYKQPQDLTRAYS